MATGKKAARLPRPQRRRRRRRIRVQLRDQSPGGPQSPDDDAILVRLPGNMSSLLSTGLRLRTKGDAGRVSSDAFQRIGQELRRIQPLSSSGQPDGIRWSNRSSIQNIQRYRRRGDEGLASSEGRQQIGSGHQFRPLSTVPLLFQFPGTGLQRRRRRTM